MGWQPNPGHCPEDARGKRVRVVLAKDRKNMAEPHYDSDWNPMSQAGWPADGKGACRWSIRRSPFDVAFYDVIGA